MCMTGSQIISATVGFALYSLATRCEARALFKLTHYLRSFSLRSHDEGGTTAGKPARGSITTASGVGGENGSPTTANDAGERPRANATLRNASTTGPSASTITANEPAPR